MKKLSTFILVVFIGILCFSGCMKDITVKEYPNLLFNVDITPGEEDKEIALFLGVSKDNPDYKISDHGKNYVFVEINNTLKSMNVTDLNIEGVEDLVEGAKIRQVVQENNEENPILARIVFEKPDPEVKFNLIFQVENIEERDVKNIVNKSQDAMSAVRTVGTGHVEPDYVMIALIFWVVVIIIIIVAYKSNKAG